ncbi:MAG: outer membrane protein assembly factor BamA [Terriglobales bacterium]
MAPTPQRHAGFLCLLFLLCLPLVRASAQALPAAPVAAPQSPNVIAAIECHGNHRVPCQTIRARITSKPGAVYDPAQINRDFNSLWNLNQFDDVTFSTERSPQGIILHVTVSEKPLIRDIKYNGLKSITESDVSDRYKARGVHLERDSAYDPTVEKHAEVAIKELLAEHGRQYATVKPVLNVLPPSSVNLTFNIDEGPKVQVGKLTFSGNKVLSSGTLEGAMKQLHPIGIPYSLIFEHLFTRTYDATKLSQDLESIRCEYQNRGYFEALVEDPSIKLRTTHSHRILFWGGGQGRSVDINTPVVEGDKFHVGKVSFINNNFITDDGALSQILGLKTGDVMDVSKLRKGLENLHKFYGQYGYINFVASPDPRPDDKSKLVNLTMDMQEGKPFYVRRIEFSGNTTTRDKVIRRELLLEEGNRFNSVAWDNSILRLNQLGYFATIAPEDASVTQDTSGPEGEVDINLHLKEKGKNSIGLQGGVSGIAGSFLGLNYSTNNFLGLGETLSVSTEYGALTRNITFGFTEPYLRDRPIQLGFTAYLNDFHYDQAKQASILAGQNLDSFFSALGSSNLLNYAQNQRGFTLTTSYPKLRSFTRYGLTYRWDNSTIQPFTQAATLLFNSVSFNGVSGPNSLRGIITSELIPSYTINTVDNPNFPTHGKSVSLSLGVAGLGGNVKLVQPSLQLEYFHPSPIKNHVLGFRFLGSMVSGYGGDVPPTFDRFYTGGEDTIRGFDIMAVTPIALIPTETTTVLLDPINPSQPLTINIPNPTPGNPGGTIAKTFPIKIPTFQFSTPGGDTMAIGNFEYRIPITQGEIPVSLSLFADAGMDRITQFNQLRVNEQVLGQLKTDFGRSFPSRIPLAAGTNQQVRFSTGIEIEATLPIVHAPVRVYYAVNPGRVDTIIRPQVLFTQADFERGIPAAFLNDAAVQQSIAFTMHQLQTVPGTPFKEAPHVLRFTIGRTF